MTKITWIFITLMYIFSTPTAYAHGGDTSLIHACVSNNSGTLKIVGANEVCSNNQTPLHLQNADNGESKAGGGAIMTLGGRFSVCPANSSSWCSNTRSIQHGLWGDFGYRVTRDATIKNMKLFIIENSYEQLAPLTIYINGVATSLTTLIPPTTINNIDVPVSINVQEGDLVTLILDLNNETNMSGVLHLSVSYEIL